MSAQEITPNASPAQSPSAAVAGNTPMGLQQPAVALSTSSTFNLNLDVKEVQQELSSPQLVAQSGILADKLASLDGGTALARGGGSSWLVSSALACLRHDYLATS